MTDIEQRLERAQQQHIELTQRAVVAATTIARAHGLQVDDPGVLAQGCAVRIHLSPAPVVARVSTLTALMRAPIDSWLAREVEVAAFLASRGAPVVPPSDVLPPGPHHHEGLSVTFWRYVPATSAALPDAPLAGRMLADLHTALRDYPGPLPLLAPPLNDIPRALERLEQAGNILPADSLLLLRKSYERLLPRLSESALGPLQPLHGDAHVYNLIPVADGWLWNDFEDTCRGPIGWDLASMDSDGQALAAYPGAPGRESLELFRKVRRLHAITWGYALIEQFPDWGPHVASMLEALRQKE
ncbi:aminoglycoside phosphotransferase family protein [Stigmatella sp. ncwal1]|uniref:Aminoglycoside phosphotransferase family protein n=1 Tax=Stigmatella ashevillensis TaxID=2995309 RepID=A0ABT5D0K6_9BACT|nr:aminoglycoside phosphotransferase family protein [Stigmatella ashevillena]MDC0707200.1 aminoglycoside phosphotransferase family protein [Stigmatella ashevillena]